MFFQVPKQATRRGMSVNPTPEIIVRFADDLGPFERITSTNG